MGEIIQIGNEPDPGVVKMLRALLDKAEAGELLSIAGVVNVRGNTFQLFTSPSAQGSIEMLTYLRLLQMVLESTIELHEPKRFGDED